MTQQPAGSLPFGLGPRLKELRNQAGLTLKDVEALAQDMSQSKLSRIERGDGAARHLDIEQLGKIYNASPAIVRELQELAKTSKIPRWFRSYAAVESENFARYIELEEVAASFCWYELINVPGLLQTPDYMRMVMANLRRAGADLPARKLEQRVEVRQRRQEILTREEPPRLEVVLADIVLQSHFGEPLIMAGQLEHLLDVSEMPNIGIRVLPTDRTSVARSIGPFIILDFPADGAIQLPSSVYVDGLLHFTLTHQHDDVSLYRTGWDDMSKAALSARASADEIAHRIKELRR